MPISVLISDRGAPEASPSVLRGLAAVDPGLTLRWTPQVNQWAVVRHWREADPRWRYVQEQTMAASGAHDIVGYIPNDCATDQVPAYVTALLRDWPVEDAKDLLGKMTQYNESGEATAAVVEDAIAEVIEDVTAPAKRKPGRPRKVDSSSAE